MLIICGTCGRDTLSLCVVTCSISIEENGPAFCSFCCHEEMEEPHDPQTLL